MTKYTNGTRKEELEKLVNAHKKLRNVTYGLIALLVVALIAAILKMMIPSIVCLAVMVLLRFTVHRTAREEYRQAMSLALTRSGSGLRTNGAGWLSPRSRTSVPERNTAKKASIRLRRIFFRW